jgi:FkbM family methyltransferase
VGIVSNLKKIVPVPVKDYVKNLIEQRAIKRISKIPRYRPFSTGILNNIRGIDSSSFVFMYEEIFKKNIYHFKSATSRPFIIDCGANIGLSIIYFKRLYPDSTIIAFEPDPAIFAVLQQNINRTNLTDVSLINAALWSSETTLTFFQEGADGGFVSDKTGNISVKAELLSKYITAEVDFLKMDIEGAEINVVKEITLHLKRVKNLFIEYHSYAGKKQELDDLLKILSDSGFRYFLHNVSNINPNPFEVIHVEANMDMQLNISAVRV